MARGAIGRLANGLPFLLLTCGFIGCTGFQREWRASEGYSHPGDQLAGRWEGTWESHVNGHDGKLRAIITPCSSGGYHAHYHATYLKVVPFAYETWHSTTPGGNVTFVMGEEDLGWLAGGLYQYNGQTDGDSLVVCYQADEDHGVFRLYRVDRCGCCGECQHVAAPPSYDGGQSAGVAPPPPADDPQKEYDGEP